MILAKHAAVDFRNIRAASFEPGTGLTVICGRNGQGKTNFLESIWLLTGSKSFRGSRDAMLVRHGCTHAVIESVIRRDDGREEDFRIVAGGEGCEEAGIRPARSAWIDGVEYGRASGIAGQFYAVVFSPAHLALVEGNPGGRRKFVDAALCQLYPGYLSVCRRYLRAMMQKNAALRDPVQSADGGLLDSFDSLLAESGAEISGRRAAYLAALFRDASAAYSKLCGGRENCEFSYVPCCESSEQLLEKIRSARRSDLRAGSCTVGPHREDIGIRIAESDAKSFGSRGQQRSAALSLKLAEADRVQSVTGCRPVILLDDVLSELDDSRQDVLLNSIGDRQVFLTCCEPDAIRKASGPVYQMDGGVLTRLS